jgi:hypothetical protein
MESSGSTEELEGDTENDVKQKENKVNACVKYNILYLIYLAIFLPLCHSCDILLTNPSMNANLSFMARKFSLLLFAAASLIGGALSLNAAPTTNLWTFDGDGNCHLDGNWNPANVPTDAGFRAIFNQTLDFTRTIVLDAPVTIVSCRLELKVVPVIISSPE